jgi:hypothetical protein
MLFFTFPDTYIPGLIYTGNVTSDTLAGVMGYACDEAEYDYVPPPGVWWATRPGAPHEEPEQVAERLDYERLTGLPKR